MLPVCGVQMAPRRGESEANVRITRSAIEAATGEGARLVVFPEASLTGYVFHDKDSARAAAARQATSPRCLFRVAITLSGCRMAPAGASA